jgi:hypothetical protein
MPLLLSEVYDALLEAGASDAKARSAATAIADYHNRLVSIESKLDRLDALFTQGRLEMRTLLGILIALAAGISWKVW